VKALTRILIVEDNPDDEELLMRQLVKAELHEHVRVIRDGGKALKFLMNDRGEGEELAAVFLDLKLPTVGGLALLKAIRVDERTRHLPVIVMTSSNSPEEMEQCRELGVACYVSKPLTFSSFAKAFTDVFEARRLQ
jgi:two-component system response regulator